MPKRSDTPKGDATSPTSSGSTEGAAAPEGKNASQSHAQQERPPQQPQGPSRNDIRDKLIGLGKSSIRKSYYPELQHRVRELERFRVLLDHSSDAIFLADAQTGALFDSNATAASMLGCTPKDLENQALSDIFPLRPAERILKHLRSPGTNQSVFMVATEARHGVGPSVPVEVSVRSVPLADGTYGILSARDVSERLLAEKALRDSEDKYRNIFKNALEGIFQTTSEGRVLVANQAMAEIVGYDSPEDFTRECHDLGKQLYENSLDRKRLIKLLNTRGKIEGFETRFRRKDGTLIWVSVNMRVVRNNQGEIDHFEGSFLDISARKSLEEREHTIKEQLRHAVRDRTRALLAKTRELEEANTRLMELDEMKSAFLSSVSHELRTPLTSILGFAKLINRDFSASFLANINDEAKAGRGQRILENLNIIQGEGERLTRLINDFLDLSKIEAGRLEWRDKVVRPAELVREVFEAVRGQFEQKPDVKTILDIGTELPILRVDPDRIKQVLFNLLSNAYKFTEKGHIRLEVKAEPKGAALLFLVHDTGMGVPLGDQEKIFDKFHQSRQPDTLPNMLLDKPRGTGLGLSICRQIVQHYGGSIRVESAPGQGSVFTVRVPSACRCDDPTIESDLDTFVAGKSSILVVDDDPGITSFLSQTLSLHGFNVATASCGQNALYKARNLKPDLITMDLLMPGMDGHDAIAALRSDAQTRSIPILVISVMQEAHEAGGDASLTKPVDENMLLDAVAGLLSKQQPEHPMLALHTNGKAELAPYFTLCEGCIIHCTEPELWEHINAGFKGTVIVPQSPTLASVVERLHAIRDIHLLLLPSAESTAP